MLACLPVPAPSIQLLTHSQMNTGLQKWDTTQKMRSAQYPSPAQLDAYAKKVANNPLTIKIFPSSVKVPQRKHVRRTVNGLDTSSRRSSPYPSQVSTASGLLAVVKAPLKGILKEFDGSRARFVHSVVMNPQGGPYSTASTLNLSQTVPRVQGVSGQPAPRMQGVSGQPQIQSQKSLPPPLLLQAQQGLPHPQAVQQHKALPHPPRLQGQPSLSQQQAVRPELPPAPRLAPSHTHVLLQQPQPGPQGPPGLRHLPDMTQQACLQHAQGFSQSQSLPQAAGPPSSAGLMLLQPPPGAQVPGKLPDADAPPNVTVSTSTIPLSMAASLHQNRPGDLSSIVHQISRFCQARAGSSATSVCEGQIANPSPISRSQLLSASSRVCGHNPGLGPLPSCALGPAPVPTPVLALPSMSAMTRVSAYHDMKQQAQQPQMPHWTQQQLAHLHPLADGPQPAKSLPHRDGPPAPGFPTSGMSYPQDLCVGQPFGLKHPIDKSTPSPPVSAMPGSVSYSNGHYMAPPWNDSSGSQDLAMAFHGGFSGASMDSTPGVQYRTSGGHTNLQPVEYMGGDLQAACFREQTKSMLGKVRRALDSGEARNIHIQHPGCR